MQIAYTDEEEEETAYWDAVPLPELRSLVLKGRVALRPNLQDFRLPDGEAA